MKLSKYLNKWIFRIAGIVLPFFTMLWFGTSENVVMFVLGINPPSEEKYNNYCKSTVVAIDPDKDQIVENHQVKWTSILYLDKPELDFGNFKCISTDNYSVGDTIYIKYTSDEDMWYEIITEEEYNLAIDY